MNWYKKNNQILLNKEASSYKVKNDEDRNRINQNVRSLKEMAKDLSYLRKYVYQNSPHARDKVRKMLNDKKMSNFPSVSVILRKADAIARDNYKTFAIFCDEALQKMYIEIKEMENARKTYVNSLGKKKGRSNG